MLERSLENHPIPMTYKHTIVFQMFDRLLLFDWCREETDYFHKDGRWTASLEAKLL